MTTTYKTPESYEHAVSLMELGLLLWNVSSSEPRNAHWCLIDLVKHAHMTDQLRDAYTFDRRSGGGWWVTDFAYILEE